MNCSPCKSKTLIWCINSAGEPGSGRNMSLWAAGHALFYRLCTGLRQYPVAGMHFCSCVAWCGKKNSRRTESRRRKQNRKGGCMTWQEHLLFHNNPEPFTEGMVLLKHPFHLCWIPRTDAWRLGGKSGGDRRRNVQKARQKRPKQNVNTATQSVASTV